MLMLSAFELQARGLSFAGDKTGNEVGQRGPERRVSFCAYLRSDLPGLDTFSD